MHIYIVQMYGVYLQCEYLWCIFNGLHIFGMQCIFLVTVYLFHSVNIMVCILCAVYSYGVYISQCTYLRCVYLRRVFTVCIFTAPSLCVY